MKTKIVLLFVLIVCGPLAQAASMISQIPILVPADIRSDGALITAVNCGGENVVVNGVAFAGSGFGFDPATPPFDAQWAASGDDFFRGFLAGTLANSSLDALFENAFVGVGTRRLTLGGLVPGAVYRLQLFLADDSIAPRSLTIGLLGETFSFSRTRSDPATALLIEFRPVSASLEVVFQQQSGSAPVILNGYALHQTVPEPSPALLCVLSVIGWLTFRRRRIGVVWLLLWLPASGFASLEWERKTHQFQATPEQGKASARFPFKNTGTVPVKIASIRSSCGCTTVNLEKREYAPGESGEIVAEFRFGGRVGRQEKTVIVTLAGPDAETVELRLDGQIEESLTVQPSLLFWRLGEAPSPKRIDIRAAPGHPVEITGAESSDGNFKPEVNTVEAGQHYILIVTPQTTAARVSATFTLKASAEPARKVFAIVR